MEMTRGIEIFRPRKVSRAGEHAARLAAMQAEIRTLAEASIASSRTATTSARVKQAGKRQATATVIKPKADRFRLPRLVKRNLIDRFCSTNTSELAALTTLMVVAHPDDETIGAGSRLALLGDVYIVDVTDGAPRDPECARRHGYETRDAYAETRKRELCQAMAVVGLPEDRLLSLDFVDGEASLRLAELCLKITDFIDSIRPQVVLTHPYEGGHTDHDATAFAVHLACGVLRREGVAPPAVIEFTSYHARDGEKILQDFLPHERADLDQRLVPLGKAERELKQRMFECFDSQHELLEKFSTSFEKFRPAPRYLFTRPPHEGRLNYERYGNPERGKEWRELAESALRALRMRPR